MEFRKLMAFGNSSFIVSVPKAWVEKNRLKKGDVLLVEQKPNELILSAKDSSERRKINEVTINPEGKTPEEFKTEIISLYVNNYDIITVVGVKDHEATKSIFRSLVGMEIVEETATKIVAKDLLDIQEVSLDNIVRRIDIIIRSMLTDARELDVKNADSVINRDTEVNRLSLLGFRTAKAATDNPRLLKLFNTNYWNVMLAKQIITYLERFADQIKRIIRTAKENKLDGKARSDILKLLLSVQENYIQVMKIHYEKNRQAAFKAETTTRALLKECDAILRKYPEVPIVRIIEYFQHTVGSMKGILRNVMEYE
ncbi:phosphate uptake regulator PhoU [Candidatus Woesearchaeota archaeon]|nr:phosphate uptake regulator PhoU [Candidatus Woesearchaeota archaeon]